jgi:hypothetical protein
MAKRTHDHSMAVEFVGEIGKHARLQPEGIDRLTTRRTRICKYRKGNHAQRAHVPREPHKTHQQRHIQLSPCDCVICDSQGCWAQSICHAALHCCWKLLAFMKTYSSGHRLALMKIMMTAMMVLISYYAACRLRRAQSYICHDVYRHQVSLQVLRQSVTLHPTLSTSSHRHLSSPTPQPENLKMGDVDQQPVALAQEYYCAHLYLYYHFCCFAERPTELFSISTVALTKLWHAVDALYM